MNSLHFLKDSAASNYQTKAKHIYWGLPLTYKKISYISPVDCQQWISRVQLINSDHMQSQFVRTLSLSLGGKLISDQFDTLH